MNTAWIKIVAVAALFAAVIASGFWLKGLGKPYPGLPFNLHKLIALGTAVAVVLLALRENRAVPLGGLEWALLAAAGACFLAAVVSGGLVSIEKPMPAFVGWLHRLMPFAALLSSAGLFFQLASRWLR